MVVWQLVPNMGTNVATCNEEGGSSQLQGSRGKQFSFTNINAESGSFTPEEHIHEMSKWYVIFSRGYAVVHTIFTGCQRATSSKAH